MMNQEPVIPIHLLSTEARAFAGAFVSSKGASRGRIKTSRPDGNEAYYVWRMVRFYASPDPKASCMPMAAMDSLPTNSADHANTCKRAYAYWRGTGIELVGDQMWTPEGGYRHECSCDHAERDAAAKANRAATAARLDALVDEIVATVPGSKQYGLRRWSRALAGGDLYASAGIVDPANAAVTNGYDELEGAMM